MVPFRLRRVQRVNFIGDYQEALNQLMEVLGYSGESFVEATSGKIQPNLSETFSAETKPVATQKIKNWKHWCGKTQRLKIPWMHYWNIYSNTRMVLTGLKLYQ